MANAFELLKFLCSLRALALLVFVGVRRGRTHRQNEVNYFRSYLCISIILEVICVQMLFVIHLVVGSYVANIINSVSDSTHGNRGVGNIEQIYIGAN